MEGFTSGVFAIWRARILEGLDLEGLEFGGFEMWRFSTFEDV